MQNSVDAGNVFDYVVFRIQSSSCNARDLSELDLQAHKAEFCELLSGEALSKHVLYDIALHWLDGDCNENLTLIHHCMTNADGPSARKILSYARDGRIDEQTARDIASVVCVVSEFVDRDYEDHLEEYEGLLPIWGDDWDYITELLLEKASQGVSGADILSAIQQWVNKGAYNSCPIEDALEALANNFYSLIDKGLAERGYAPKAEPTSVHDILADATERSAENNEASRGKDDCELLK